MTRSATAHDLPQDAKSIAPNVTPAYPPFQRAAAAKAGDPPPCAVVLLDFDDTLSFFNPIPKNEIAFNQELLQAEAEHLDVLFWSREQHNFLHPPQTFSPNLDIFKYCKKELQNLVLASEQNHVDLYILTASPTQRKPSIKLFFDAIFRNTGIRNPFTDDRILCVITDEYFLTERQEKKKIEAAHQSIQKMILQTQFEQKKFFTRTIGKVLACLTLRQAYSKLPSDAFVFVDDQKCNIESMKELAKVPVYEAKDHRSHFAFLDHFIKKRARESAAIQSGSLPNALPAGFAARIPIAGALKLESNDQAQLQNRRRL